MTSKLLLAAILPFVAQAGELTDRFVAGARAVYPTEAYATYEKTLLVSPEFALGKERADLPPGQLVRWVDVEGTCNFRDIGGWNGLKAGCVYRGAEPNCHPFDPKKPKSFHNLSATPAGLETLSKRLGVRTDLDLRGRGESPTPDATPIPGAKLVRLACASYTNFLLKTEMAAKLLRVFADPANYPVYFHCYGGADRTGSLAFLLEGLCGVSEVDLCIDYELTSFSRIGRRSRVDKPYWYAAMVRAMKERPGATLQEKIEHYVRVECGLTADEVAAIRRQLVDPDAKPSSWTPPWRGTTLGAEDEVPPPWTRPEAGVDGFRCWGRSYAFGGKGLVTSVVTSGKELLAAPVTVEMNGRPLTFEVRRTAAGVSFADYELKATDADVPVTVRLKAEFDGFLWFDVTWGGADAKEVRDFKIHVPIKRELVIGYDRCRGTRDDTPLPAGTVGDWTFNPLKDPLFWFGNDVLGLMGGIDSIRGWRLKDKAKGYALTVSARTAELTMTIADTAFVPTEPRTFGFYLEATPTKPKNLTSAAMPATSLDRWCQVDRIFDFKCPGCYDEKRCAKFRQRQQEGHEVYYYASTTAISPLSTQWAQFGADWTMHATPTSGIARSMAKTEAGRMSGTWTRGCLNCRDFFEHKLFVADRFLNDPAYEVRNLYYDVAEPGTCSNPRHGCVWTDDFGARCRDAEMKSCREFHKRLLRLLKRKNPKGILYGHSGPSRTPSDMFFERMVMGENYAYAVTDKESYYDVLTPDELRIKYASRSNETVIDMLPQIVRALQMRRKDRLKTYRTTDSASDRAIRHCAAYYKIYDLNIWGNAAGRFDGDQWIAADDAVTKLGPDRRYWAYYHPDAPLRAAERDPRFLWAVFAGKGKGLLILLNDTDQAVTRTLAGDLGAVGVAAAVGTDLFTGETFAFAGGSLEVSLPPRESRFIAF